MQRTLEYTRPVRPTRLCLALTLILALAAACTPPPEPEGPDIETAEDLLAALRQAGVEIEETAMPAPDPELGRGSVVFLGPARIEVYEADSEAAQRVALQALLQQMPGVSTPNLWGRGKVVVIYDGLDGATIALLSGLLGDSVNLDAPAQDEPYPPAVAAAIGWMAQETGADPGAVVVETFAASEWPDACLGLPEADEACAGVITPGWRITLRIGAEIATLRADELGTVIRQEP
jgi:hypothetical protein